MYISFSRKAIGGFRIHYTKRVGVWTMLFVSLLYLTLWATVGVCWLFFYLPIRTIVRAVRKSKAEKKGGSPNA